MMRMGRRPNSYSKSGLGIALAVLVAIVLFVSGPLPVPAADPEVATETTFATPVALDPTVEPTPTCTPAPMEEIDPSVDAGIATPIAIETVEADPCGLAEVVEPPATGDLPADVESPREPTTEPTAAEPATTETARPESEIAETPTPGAAGDPALVGFPDDPTPTPEPASDPGMTGLDLPAEAVEAAADPSLAGMPSDAKEPVADGADAVDPMLTGFDATSTTVPDVAAVVDPLLDGLPIDLDDESGGPSAQEVFDNRDKSVSVDVISADGTVLAGGQVSYRFRVANVGRKRAIFDLAVVIDQPGWSATVTVPPQYVRPNGKIRIDAGVEIEVTVVVTAPVSASPGDRALTTLNVEHLR